MANDILEGDLKALKEENKSLKEQLTFEIGVANAQAEIARDYSEQNMKLEQQLKAAKDDIIDLKIKLLKTIKYNSGMKSHQPVTNEEFDDDSTVPAQYQKNICIQTGLPCGVPCNGNCEDNQPKK